MLLPRTRTFRVEAAIPNPDADIPSGMTAEITLSAEPVQSVMLRALRHHAEPDGDLGNPWASTGPRPWSSIRSTSSTTRRAASIVAGIPDDVRIQKSSPGRSSSTGGAERVNAVPADEETIRRLGGEFAATDAR